MKGATTIMVPIHLQDTRKDYVFANVGRVALIFGQT